MAPWRERSGKRGPLAGKTLFIPFLHGGENFQKHPSRNSGLRKKHGLSQETWERNTEKARGQYQGAKETERIAWEKMLGVSLKEKGVCARQILGGGEEGIYKARKGKTQHSGIRSGPFFEGKRREIRRTGTARFARRLQTPDAVKCAFIQNPSRLKGEKSSLRSNCS